MHIYYIIYIYKSERRLIGERMEAAGVEEERTMGRYRQSTMIHRFNNDITKPTILSTTKTTLKLFLHISRKLLLIAKHHSLAWL